MTIQNLFIAAFCCAVPVHAAVIVLGADKDATIFQNNVDNSNGAGPGLFAGTNGTLSPRRTLISFDLSVIPTGSIITDVQLTLTLGQVAGSGGTGMGGNDVTRVISLYELTRNWGEGTTGSTSSVIGGTGQGFPAGQGDATWNAAFYAGSSSVLWTTPGGDHDPLPSAALTLSGTTVGTAYTWLSTPALVADVQRWVDQPVFNFGWEIINADETGMQTFYSFYSSEWSDRAGGNPDTEAEYTAQEPRLQITYVPEPASLVLIAAGGLSLLRRRPRRSHAGQQI